MSHRIFRITLLGLSLGAGLLLASPASAVYKCTGADGKVSYQDRPCTEGSTQQSVTVRKSAAGDTSDELSEAALLQLVSQEAMLSFCQKEDHATFYPLHQRWREKFKLRLARNENTARYREHYRSAAIEIRDRWSNASPEMRSRYCKETADHMNKQVLD